MANIQDCDLQVSVFELQSLYQVPFQTHTLGKGMDPLVFPAMG